MAENKLEELVTKFVETKEREDFGRMMDVLEKSNVFIPATAPLNMTPEQQNAMKKGQPMKVDPKNQPQVCLLKQNDGTKVFPIFTTREQIPKEKMPPVIMNAPFEAVIAMVKSNMDQVSSIVVNPFTQGVVLNETLVEMASKRFAALKGQGTQTVKMTEQQFHSFSHTQVAREKLAGIFFKNPEAALSDLRVKKEQMIIDAYEAVYPQNVTCPYSEDDVAVMMLQIEEDLLVIRIDTPETNKSVGSPERIYITYEGDNKLRYFIIERGSKETPGNIIEMAADGTFKTLDEAPDNGVEIETIVSLVRPS